jgi:hypothetical protein
MRARKTRTARHGPPPAGPGSMNTLAGVGIGRPSNARVRVRARKSWGSAGAPGATAAETGAKEVCPPAPSAPTRQSGAVKFVREDDG